MKAKRFYRFGLIAVILVAVTAVAGLFAFPTDDAEATNYCITARCIEAANKEAEAKNAREAAASEKQNYQTQVSEKTAEINEIQFAISRNEAEISEISTQIENTERKIERLIESLKNTIVKLYLNDSVSEIEIFAKAESLVDWTTKSTNQQIVQEKVKTLAAEAKQAKIDLEQQKVDQETKKAENEARHAVAADKQYELQLFVNEWAGREADYSAEATAQQAIVNTEIAIAQCEASSGTWNGSSCAYPSSNSALPSGAIRYYTSDRNYGNTYGNYSFANAWGNGYARQCTSYAGHKAYEYAGYGLASYHQPWGNAKYWAGSAANRGLLVTATPRANSIGVSGYGTYGHVFWVEDVVGDRIYITDYNRRAIEAFGNAYILASEASNAGIRYIYPK